MKYSVRTFLRLKQCLQFIALWVTAFFFYVFISYSIIDDSYFLNQQLTTADFLVSELSRALSTGVFMGFVFYLLQEYIYPRFFHGYGILMASLLQSLLFIMVCYIVFIIVLQLSKVHYIRINNLIALRFNAKWLTCFTIYCLIVHLFITLVQAFRQRLGGNYCKSLLHGNYMSPVIEYRIFMFLDMYPSRTIAEVEHYQYSHLLQECFIDLSEIVTEQNAEVYQYVNDGVILTWKVKQGFERKQCIALYTIFSSRLLEKKDLYQKKFGLVPKFKASINEGLVTVAEIGQIKTEIAYHGDVLSTTASVRDLCRDQGNLLITQAFFKQLSFLEQDNFTEIETTVLRGKKRPVVIYKSNG
ncbi:hypothetical protein NJT12_15520 [Flavobacterium sp. AC]|uniref:Adenylate cyclase n=1 Tax=Flavobacterium azizsancarii TaxID=2961580 RepID=A0ABT4WEP1_9FLAO|nr:hypothetical protein [Flavobacterium azizsancarii]MDA6071024.1 hypothetical protein [Flavobacterium azizsancarii]